MDIMSHLYPLFVLFSLQRGRSLTAVPVNKKGLLFVSAIFFKVLSATFTSPLQSPSQSPLSLKCLLPPLRIAILECGTPLPNTANKYGSYGGAFASLLRSGADALSYPNLSSSSGLSISTFDVLNTLSYPSLSGIDAILLTASGSNAFADDPWILKLVAFVQEVLEQRRVRIIGACFGHQIVGRALGAKVGRSDKGWETSVTPIDLTTRGQEIFGKKDLVSILFKPFIYLLS
jgi:hypothetical protein